MRRNHLSSLKRNALTAILENNEVIQSDDNIRKLVHELSVYQEELEAQREQLEESQLLNQALVDRFSKIFELSPVGYAILDENYLIVEMNKAASELLSIQPRLSSLSPQNFQSSFKLLESRRKLSNWLSQSIEPNIDLQLQQSPTHWIRLDKASFDSANGDLLLISISDITKQIQHQHSLEERANYDQLTHLPNRQLMLDILKQSMSRAKRLHSSISVIFIDIDGFKTVNDEYGHEVGDQLLIDVAQSIKAVIRLEDTLCRYGGDEFVLIISDALTLHDTPLIDRILSSVSGIKYIKEKPINISASIGVAICDQTNNVDPQQLIRQADIAMYEAKQDGKNDYRIFDARRDKSGGDEHKFRKRCLTAVAERQFEVYYQPKYDLAKQSANEFEALLRWNHPEHGLISPSHFIHHIKTVELSLIVDSYVIESVLEQLVKWAKSGFRPKISINLSAHFVQSPNFNKIISRYLDEYPEVLPSQICFEITETFLLNNLDEASEIMTKCQDYGIEFSLDDFGTGYSSLSYLKRLPFDELKIDMSFIRDMLQNESDMELVKGIINLSNAFRLRTVAEGVETLEQLEALKALNCDLVQGFLLSPAIQAQDVIPWRNDFKL